MDKSMQWVFVGLAILLISVGIYVHGVKVASVRDMGIACVTSVVALFVLKGSRRI